MDPLFGESTQQDHVAVVTEEGNIPATGRDCHVLQRFLIPPWDLMNFLDVRLGEIVVQRSTTRLVDEVFEKFDSQNILSAFYHSWKRRKDVRYWGVIQSHVRDDGSTDDEAAMQEIVLKWAEAGAVAARLGTELHSYAERVLNSKKRLPPS